MDISKITDIKELKAMAYDQLVAKQNAEINFNAINQRIMELEQNPPVKKEDKEEKK